MRNSEFGVGFAGLRDLRGWQFTALPRESSS